VSQLEQFCEKGRISLQRRSLWRIYVYYRGFVGFSKETSISFVREAEINDVPETPDCWLG
jgi:hypothetical protein